MQLKLFVHFKFRRPKIFTMPKEFLSPLGERSAAQLSRYIIAPLRKWKFAAKTKFIIKLEDKNNRQEEWNYRRYPKQNFASFPCRGNRRRDALGGLPIIFELGHHLPSSKSCPSSIGGAGSADSGSQKLMAVPRVGHRPSQTL